MSESEGGGARIYAEEFEQMVAKSAPIAGTLNIKVERFEAGHVNLRLPYGPQLTRPGGTIASPALMTLADIALYGVVMSLIGRGELAVTTDLSFHFLAKPAATDILAEATILKIGRRLAVGQVLMRSHGRLDPVCHVVGSYSIPLDVG